jgi:hypothetical protein
VQPGKVDHGDADPRPCTWTGAVTCPDRSGRTCGLPRSHRRILAVDATSRDGRSRCWLELLETDQAIPRLQMPGNTSEDPRSHPPRRRARRAHKTGPSVAQGGSPDAVGVSPLLQDRPWSGHGLDLHEGVTGTAWDDDLPWWSARLDVCEPQARDLQDKDSTCADVRSGSRRRSTSMVSKWDLDRTDCRPGGRGRRSRPVGDTNLDRRTHKRVVSEHRTRLVRSWKRVVVSRGRVV